MKNIYIFMLMLILSLESFNAQEVTFGVKGGLNLASISEYQTVDPDLRVSFHFGGFVEIPLWNKFSLQPELLYSGQGFKETYSSTHMHTVRLNYLNLPILIKYYVWNGLSIETGPQMGMLISSNVSEYEKKLDLATGFGLGYKINTDLGFGVRYNFGLSYFDNFSNSDSPPFNKHRVLQIWVAYTF